MKVLGLYIDPNGIKNKNTLKNPYPPGIKIVQKPFKSTGVGIMTDLIVRKKVWIDGYIA